MSNEVSLISIYANYKTEIITAISACFLASVPYMISLIKMAFQSFIKNRLEKQIKKHIFDEVSAIYEQYTIPQKQANQDLGLGFILTDIQKAEAKQLVSKAAKARISDKDRELAKQYLGNIDDYVDIQIEVIYQTIKAVKSPTPSPQTSDVR